MKGEFILIKDDNTWQTVVVDNLSSDIDLNDDGALHKLAVNLLEDGKFDRHVIMVFPWCVPFCY